ncbi:hypothetical protein SCUCBS95973_001266 [Sporothrix curviconia]|uniref:Clr5 domain-containing protein n=1 Tax=Sporothrix curviconia TaxID=1260050 RepID=A0ABP0AX55_9PEZI
MIHNHYEPGQILWFLRNYWRFDREAMIAEWHRTFQDSNFGKSQYQWLKSRYGMKIEWGASLNHPPFPGARPGLPGTENYIPPDIPANPPRATFRTRSDSPAPVLITAPATAAAQGIVSHAPVAQAHMNAHSAVPGGSSSFGQARRSSAGAGRMLGMNHSSVAANTAGPTPVSTPTMAPVMPAAGSGTYVFGNNPGRNGDRATPRSFSGSLNQSHGTYSFASNMGNMSLASPFMSSTAANMGVQNSMNPIVSSFAAAGHGSSMPTLNGSFPVGGSGGVSTDSPQMSAAAPMQSFSYGGPSHQSFQHLAGGFSGNPHGAQSMFSFDGGIAGLGINHGVNTAGNAFFQAAPSGFVPDFASDMTSPAQMDMPMPSAMGCAGNQSGSSDEASTSIPSNAKIIANVMRNSSPISSIAEAIVSPHGSLGQADAGNKRKRSAVEVEFQPPKRANMASGSDQASLPFQVFAAELPSEAATPKIGGKSTKARAKKTASPHTPTSASVPSSASTIPCPASSVPSPTTAEVQEIAMSPAEFEGDWYNGPHEGCSVDARHCHNKSGGLFFLQCADFEKAAMGHTSRVSTPTGCPETSVAPTTGPVTPTAAPTPADAQVATPSNVYSTSPPAGLVLASAGEKAKMEMSFQTPVQAHKEVLPAQSQLDSDATQKSAAQAAGLEEYEYNLVTHVGAALQQYSAGVVKVPAVVEAAATNAAGETLDDFSSMANFDADFHLDDSVLDAFYSDKI